jgi:hypothetical protein
LDIKYKKQLFLLKESTIILWSFDYLFSKWIDRLSEIIEFTLKIKNIFE